MGKFFKILFGFMIIPALFFAKQESFALSYSKILVSPVNVPTAQTSYGVYPNTVDMIANDIINTFNQKSNSLDAPDLNTANGLIESYGLSKSYKQFLMNYRDNNTLDYKTCNVVGKKLSVDKILLVSGGYDVQNVFLNGQKPSLFSRGLLKYLPWTPMYGKDIFLWSGLTYASGELYKNNSYGDPLKPCYRLNVHLNLIDTVTGVSIWDKTYQKDMEASNFGVPVNSFGENVVSSEELRKFSKKIAEDANFELIMLTNNVNYKSVDSKIITSDPSSEGNFDKPTDGGNLTKDGQPSSLNDKYLENIRKENFKRWIRQRVQQ